MRATLKLKRPITEFELDIDENSIIPHWIPCSERLPEYDFTDVLVCYHDQRTGCEDDYYIMQAYVVRGHWCPTINTGGMDYLEPVAWMPLPEPYKEGQ